MRIIIIPGIATAFCSQIELVAAVTDEFADKIFTHAIVRSGIDTEKGSGAF